MNGNEGENENGKEKAAGNSYGGLYIKPVYPNSRSNANFSFQFIASYVWYSVENSAGDLLLGLKFV